MAHVFPVLVAAAFALALSGCEEQPPEVLEAPAADADAAAASGTSAGATTGTPAAMPSEVVEAVTVAADAVVVGSATGADGAASAPRPSYTLADTVYASAHGNGLAKVYWSYEDGSSHKEEEKPANGIVTFQFSQADGMRPGTYNVGIDIDGVPVGITDFVVK